MSWHWLSAPAPNRRTRRKGPSVPIESNLDDSQVQEKANLSQECRRGGSCAATWPRVITGGKGNGFPGGLTLSPKVPKPTQLRRNSGDGIHEILHENRFPHFKPLRTPESVDQNSLPLHPTKRDLVSDGSPVKQSEEMEQSRRWKHEPAHIPDQQETIPQAAISTTPEKESGTPISHSEAPLDETPPGKSTIKSQSKDDEIQLYRSLQRMRRLREMIWGLRSRVQEQRGILRSKQYVKAAADDKYIQLARLKETRADRAGRLKSSEGKTLQELFQDCEQVRAEYGPLEDDCNALEDQLGSREYELIRLEENFVTLCNILYPHESRSLSCEENVDVKEKLTR